MEKIREGVKARDIVTDFVGIVKNISDNAVMLIPECEKGNVDAGICFHLDRLKVVK